MQFTCTIDMDNAAFEEDPTELPKQLGNVAARLRVGGIAPRTGVILDTNGNTVGGWAIGE